jgi:hypothetical protein
MPTISVRVTNEEMKRYTKYGPLSKTVREALELYEKERKKGEAVRKLEKLQREHPVHVDPEEIVRIIREGRDH